MYRWNSQCWGWRFKIFHSVVGWLSRKFPVHLSHTPWRRTLRSLLNEYLSSQYWFHGSIQCYPTVVILVVRVSTSTSCGTIPRWSMSVKCAWSGLEWSMICDAIASFTSRHLVRWHRRRLLHYTVTHRLPNHFLCRNSNRCVVIIILFSLSHISMLHLHCSGFMQVVASS